jgi:hypothetical protein
VNFRSKKIAKPIIENCNISYRHPFYSSVSVTVVRLINKPEITRIAKRDKKLGNTSRSFSEIGIWRIIID